VILFVRKGMSPFFERCERTWVLAINKAGAFQPVRRTVRTRPGARPRLALVSDRDLTPYLRLHMLPPACGALVRGHRLPSITPSCQALTGTRRFKHSSSWDSCSYRFLVSKKADLYASRRGSSFPTESLVGVLDGKAKAQRKAYATQFCTIISTCFAD